MIQSNLQRVIENKVSYVSGDAVSVTATGTIVSGFTNLSRGDGYNQLTGNLAKPSKWTLRYTWSTAQTFSTVRLLAFQWLDAAVPTPSGILTYTGDARAPNSSLLWTNIHKIRVLHDQIVALKPRADAGFDAKQYTVNLPGMATVQFDSTTVSQQMNGLYILLISDDIIGTAPQLTYVSELRFTDA